jgi:kynurenine formamidase
MLAELKTYRFIDLTHAFRPGIPHAIDMPDEKRVILYDFEPDNFMAHKYEIAGQWGTHADPPIHFVRGGRRLDEIDVVEMIMPLVVFDVTKQVAANHDYSISLEDVKAWEARHGRIPDGAFAALRTDWSMRWPDAEAMANCDHEDVSHTPGWSVAALEFLCTERNIGACGHETGDTDPGVTVARDEFPAETYVLQQDKFQIELLTNLNQLPAAGAIVIAAFPKPEGGSGFPARVFAIAP